MTDRSPRNPRRQPLKIEGREAIAGPPPGPECFFCPPPGSFFWGGYWYAPERPIAKTLDEVTP